MTGSARPTDPELVLRAAAAVDLPGLTPRVQHDTMVVTTPMLNLMTAARVEGLVHRAVVTGLVEAPEPATSDVEQAWLAAVRRSLDAEWWAYETISVLDEAGVPTRVLKGPAVAHLDHDDPNERVFGDADVLIRRADHGRALAALEAAGFRRVEPAVRGWWERRFGKAVMLRTPTGGELDLHLSIIGGYFGARIDHDRLWAATSEPFDLGGRTVHALALDDRWLHACCHAVLGGGSGLRALRDVAQLLLVRHADWRAVVARTTEQGADAVVAKAVRTTWRELQLDPTHPAAQWAATHVADDRQRAALDAHRSAAAAGWGPEARATLRALGPVDRCRFALGVVFPGRANLEYRGRTLLGHLRSLARAAR